MPSAALPSSRWRGPVHAQRMAAAIASSYDYHLVHQPFRTRQQVIEPRSMLPATPSARVGAMATRFAAGAQVRVHRGRGFRLDTDQPDGGADGLHPQADPADEPAAADGDHDGVDVGPLLQDLDPDCPLAGHHSASLYGET